MLMSMLFLIGRVAEIVTLLPTMGMLAWFVDQYNKVNALAPTYVLVLFIVSVLALAWALVTIFTYSFSFHFARLVALVDLLFVGAFIAGVYYLRGISDADCTSVSRTTWNGNAGDFSFSSPGLDFDTDKSCAMLKASFAFGIMNCIFFFFTALAAWGWASRTDKNRRYSSRHV